MASPRKCVLWIAAIPWCGSAVYAQTQPPTARADLEDLTTLKNYKSKRISSSDRSGGNFDFVGLDPGQKVTLADITGPACITHIWITTTAYFDMRAGAEQLVLSMYWDGATTPCVEAPLSDFFGLGHGQVYSYASAPFAVGTYGGLNCFWRMPFRERAVITVTNQGDKRVGSFYFYIDYQQYDVLPESTAYFHAQYRQRRPCKADEHYTILEARGRGHYVGCNLSIETTAASWWGEGDDRIFIDGEKEPSLHGTGSEDYFSGAWCYQEEFATQYLGMPLRGRWRDPRRLHRYRDSLAPDQIDFRIDPWRAGDLWNVYRYHIADPITFTRSLRVEIEHGHANDRSDHFASVAYWYQIEPHQPPPPLPPVAERISPAIPAALRESGWFEAEDFVYEARIKGQGNTSTQGVMWLGNIWSDGEQLVFNAKEVGDEMTLRLPVKEAGEYELLGYFAHWKAYAVFEVAIDGNKVGGSHDGFIDSMLPQVKEASFGPVTLTVGDHQVTFKIVGKTDGSTGFCIGIDRLQWRKTASSKP